jgi:hypothetical protein
MPPTQPRPCLLAAHPLAQTRVAAGCQRNYMGMHRDLCEEKTTQLYLPQNSSASRVWLVEPLVPNAPTITGDAVARKYISGVLTVTLTPPDFAGYFAIANYTVLCAPARSSSITASGLGRNVGGQVRAGWGPPAGPRQGACCSHTAPWCSPPVTHDGRPPLRHVLLPGLLWHAEKAQLRGRRAPDWHELHMRCLG